ncbi:MAG: transcriptional repressor [Candidatus Acetothermia bacterium]|nr:transcriptional repressor [Candidatus Acetothermia bacterium]MDH7505078.1 transcriptional repressor [Candidatus Acetothermia bacterium]
MLEASAFLRAEKKRLTPQRSLLLGIIRQHGHLDADEIYRLARRENPRLSLSTVYRTLNLLKELGLVEELHLGEEHHHYEAKAEEHHHLVCLSCGKVIECRLTEDLRELGRRHGFTMVSAQVELAGYCADCRKQGENDP